MTTATTPIKGLTVEKTDPDGRVHYAPILVKIIRMSDYNKSEYKLAGIGGFWKWEGNWALSEGTTYNLLLPSKPKPPGPNTKDGSMYLDIRQATLPVVDQNEPTDSQPQGPLVKRSDMEHKIPSFHEPPPVPQALGACQNHAMAFIESGIIPVPEGREPLNFLRELRDRVYREVNQAAYRSSPHYCYKHDQNRVQGSKGGWGHKIEDEQNPYCMEA